MFLFSSTQRNILATALSKIKKKNRKLVERQSVTGKKKYLRGWRMPSQYGFKVLIYIGPDSWHSQSKPGPGSRVSHWPLHRLVERCQLRTPRDHGPAKRFASDCQFGLVSAERMPKREGMPVIKQFRGERDCFWAPKPFQAFLYDDIVCIRACFHEYVPACTCMYTHCFQKQEQSAK